MSSRQTTLTVSGGSSRIHSFPFRYCFPDSRVRDKRHCSGYVLSRSIVRAINVHPPARRLHEFVRLTTPAHLSLLAVPNNISKYNYKDRMYKVDPPGPGDHLAMHLAIDGWALFREGDEAKLQATAEEKKKAAADEARKEAQKQVCSTKTNQA